ncbi:MAG: single-stranded DNA-binding protein [Deltaproteobacteria bacterium]|nr:single-stranded DNA-binding protein [Deltaproteobacteria bacterium]
MYGVNKVILIGRLGKDPELRRTQLGHAMTLLSVATSERWGQDVKTEWHKVVMYEKLAETANRFLKKGDTVYLEGKIQTRSWDDQKGVKRYMTEIVANTMEKLFSPRRETQGEYLTPPAATGETKALENAPEKAPENAPVGDVTQAEEEIVQVNSEEPLAKAQEPQVKAQAAQEKTQALQEKVHAPKEKEEVQQEKFEAQQEKAEIETVEVKAGLDPSQGKVEEAEKAEKAEKAEEAEEKVQVAEQKEAVVEEIKEQKNAKAPQAPKASPKSTTNNKKVTNAKNGTKTTTEGNKGTQGPTRNGRRGMEVYREEGIHEFAVPTPRRAADEEPLPTDDSLPKDDDVPF